MSEPNVQPIYVLTEQEAKIFATGLQQIQAMQLRLSGAVDGIAAARQLQDGLWRLSEGGKCLVLDAQQPLAAS